MTVTDDLARMHALLAESRAGEGGPLLGVPTAFKDLNLTAGVRTTFGSAVFADFVPDVSDEVVTRIEAAGMISLGKTSTPEFGSPCYTEPEVAPPSRTPWDLERMAGGSSGGAGAAVAAGLVAVAQGSDGGGSIRIPASCCGLVGLKPSRGRISAGPMYGDPVGLGTDGPLARTVRDAAALLDVMAGPAVGDPTWASPLPEDESFLGWCDRPPGRLRVARFCTPVITDAPVHPEVLAAYDAASRLLEELGHDVEDVEVPMPREAVPVFETCWSVLTALTELLPPGGEAELRPLTRWLTERGRAVSGPEFGLAIGELRRVAAADAAGAGAVRRRAHPDPGAAAAAGRRDPRRRRPGPRLREPEGVHALHRGVERDRHAGGVATAAHDGRRASGGGDARRATGGGPPAARARRAGRGGRALARPSAALLVSDWVAGRHPSRRHDHNDVHSRRSTLVSGSPRILRSARPMASVASSSTWSARCFDQAQCQRRAGAGSLAGGPQQPVVDRRG